MTFLDPTPYKLEKQYKDPFDRWKAKPDKRTTGALLRVIEPEIRKGVFAHVGQANPLIKSRARRLAIRSLQTYDPSRAKLGTHIVNSLQGLKRINRKHTEVISVPERVVYDRRQLDRIRADTEEELGREITMQEMADRTGFSIRRIQRVYDYNPATAEGAMSALPSAESSNASIAVNQRTPAAWDEVLYHDLGRTNQKIMEWSLGMYGAPNLPNKEIARRLRISPGAVSQRKQKIQQMLDDLQEMGGQF